MSLASWYLHNGNNAVRVPLGTCRTCVLCLNDRWCRGQGRRPQDTSCFPAVGNPIGNVYCEIGCIIQVNLIGCKVSHQLPVRGGTRSVEVQPLLASEESGWPSPLRQGILDAHYLKYQVNVPLLINNWQCSIPSRPVQGR